MKFHLLFMFFITMLSMPQSGQGSQLLAAETTILHRCQSERAFESCWQDLDEYVCTQRSCPPGTTCVQDDGPSASTFCLPTAAIPDSPGNNTTSKTMQSILDAQTEIILSPPLISRPSWMVRPLTIKTSRQDLLATGWTLSFLLHPDIPSSNVENGNPMAGLRVQGVVMDLARDETAVRVTLRPYRNQSTALSSIWGGFQQDPLVKEVHVLTLNVEWQGVPGSSPLNQKWTDFVFGNLEPGLSSMVPAQDALNWPVRWTPEFQPQNSQLLIGISIENIPFTNTNSTPWSLMFTNPLTANHPWTLTSPTMTLTQLGSYLQINGTQVPISFELKTGWNLNADFIGLGVPRDFVLFAEEALGRQWISLPLVLS